ncbi:MAG: HAD hydrolase family protein [Deltaproteobacteria bacterium]|jgi:3-deoxy-D-manno-octulosonate 8-phosphate phosphatase (KDO 8-P phosphatase)|nr:HAD hydrolase family protein [Deltaproteobacteria bacterium]
MTSFSVFPPIKWVGFDVDGVMTDGGIILDDNGGQQKRFHSRDGHALKMLIKSGIAVSIITGRKSDVVALRAKETGILDVHQGITNKGLVYQKILADLSLSPEETAFAGDDIVDLPIMTRCALPMAPKDASMEALKVAKFISDSPAGYGAVREMVKYILTGLGHWDKMVAGYSL